MYLEINSDNPHNRTIKQAVEILRKGGVIIYPTDTVYGMGCDIHNHKAVEKLCRIKGVKAEKTTFSFIFHDMKHIAEYSIVYTNIYKMLKRALPGPYTFILKASSLVPKILKAKKKTIGIRIPDNNIVRELVRELGNPIITTSIPMKDDMVEYATDPDMIYEEFGKSVDLVIDGGIGGIQESTVVNCTEEPFEIIREGAGDVDLL